MKILSKEAEQVVVRTRRCIDGIKCDICERLIKPTNCREDSSQYFKVTTGHNDWGNDSCESIEHFDICPNCIGEFVSKYARECSYTGYLELESDHICKNEYEYD